MISIIMPAFNASKYIESSIRSVLRQTYNDFELIIIDDCSSDNTYEIMQAIASEDSRIILYQNASNKGISQTRNFGVERAKGDWIAFLDSDDVWDEHKLEYQINFSKDNPDAKLIYTSSKFMNDAGELFAYELKVPPQITYRELLGGNYISCSSVLILKDVIKEFPMMGDYMHEDYVTWLKILKKYGYAYGIAKPLLIYRLTASSKSSNRVKSAQMLYNSYRHIGYCKIISALFVLKYSFFSIKKRSRIKHNNI